MARELKPQRKKKEKIDFKYNTKLYLGFLLKYKWMFVALVLLVFVIQSANIIQKFLFKILIDKGTEMTAGLLTSAAYIKVLYVLAAVFILTISIKAFCQWLDVHIVNILEVRTIYDMKNRFFNHIIGLSHNFHTSHKTGSLISRLTRGGRAMERMTDNIIFQFLPLIFEFTVAAISIAVFDQVSMIVITITVGAFIAYNLIFQRMQMSANLKENSAEDIEKANIADFITNVDSIRFFGKENFIKARFAKISTNTKQAMLNHWQYFRFFDSIEGFIVGLGTFFLIYFSVMKLIAGTMTIGTLVFIYTVYLGLAGPLFSFVWGMRDFYRGMADFNDLFQYGKIKNDIKDKPNAKNLNIEKGTIEFRNISFDYGKRKIFKNLNLKIKKNEKVALVGHSGSGKTTLVKLLYRFYDVERGKILIDGQDIKDFKQESLREAMSTVPQECILFDDTVSNNIAFSKPDAKKEEVLQALKFSQLFNTVKKFPYRENTIVGERGIKLSAGEKQRVSIARALLANKKVLVLDEATSSLDSRTEHEIQRELKKLMEGRTSLIIAHRLSTIMHADRIIVMKEGKIVQSGTHNSLIRRPGEYRNLWNLQKGGYIGE
jgi:ATP-binding cassette subfamily B protein